MTLIPLNLCSVSIRLEIHNYSFSLDLLTPNDTMVSDQFYTVTGYTETGATAMALQPDSFYFLDLFQVFNSGQYVENDLLVQTSVLCKTKSTLFYALLNSCAVWPENLAGNFIRFLGGL